MTSRNEDPHNGFDWNKAEQEINDQTSGEVLDLDAARDRRISPNEPLAPSAVSAEDDAVPPLVDSPAAQQGPRITAAGLRTATRKAIVPAWLLSRAELRDAARWTVGHVAHAVGYHLTRTPKYAGKLAWRAPRGLLRAMRAWLRWWFDLQGETVRQAMADKNDAESYLKVSKLRDQRVRWRGLVTAAVLLSATPAGFLGWQMAGHGMRWLILAAVTGALGAYGRPGDRPLLDTAVVVPQVAKLTSDVVTRALGVLGVAGINQALAKNPKAINFPSPITRDGPGWRADVDLPYGVTAGEVIERRDKLASGLGRPLGCVWPEGNHDISPGRLTVWVGDRDMASARQPAWPLLKSGAVDLFKAWPFGTDPRGRTVDMELMFTNLLIGSIPGYGKTFALRLPLLAAALDPRAEMWVFELKGSGDLEPVERVCARYASGADDETAELALEALRALREECQRRAQVIKGLPRSECPENKVTPELASRRSLGLHPLICAIDECQELFSHKEFGDEAGELAEKIIKLGRALGVTLLLATQRPDAKSVPTGVSANVGTRFCLRVMGQMENDMILGTSSYKNGVRATMFAKKDKGVGYLVGSADDAQIVKGFYVDGLAAESIAERARVARQKAGTLTGHATGQPTAAERPTYDLLADIASVVPAGEDKVWSETVVARLAELRPDVYGGWDAKSFAAALVPYRIATGQVWGTDDSTGKGANRKGIARAHIIAALTAREQRRKAS